MAKSKKKKPLPPRVKRMKRPARLESAKKWIPTYPGKHLLRGYCIHYGVNWRCAAQELKILGIRIDPTYIASRERAERELTKRRQIQKDKKTALQNNHWHSFTDKQSAYMAGDFAALHDLEMREQYGDDWEQQMMNEYASLDGETDDDCSPDEEFLESNEISTMVAPEDEDDPVPF